jgi:uncharacterized membrane protein YphA (DoxX/SURF4 family)
MGTETTINADAAAGHTSKSLARHLPTAARLLMGLIFFVFGLNGFLNFLPQPATAMPEGAVAFGEALMKAGYMFPLIKGTEVIVGVLLLANRFVPLALALIAPVVVNIIAFHAILAPSGIAPAIVVLVLEVYLAWSYRAVYRPMLAMRATPGSK